METCYLCLDKITHIKCNTCNSSFCVSCSKYYHQQDSAKNHVLENLPGYENIELNRNNNVCIIHKNELMKFYCRTCDYKLICLECMNEPFHITHSFFTYKDLIDGFSDRLVEFENEYQQLLLNSSSVTNSLNDILFYREISFQEAKKDIEEQFVKIDEKLKEKKNFLIKYLENLQNVYKIKLSSVSDESNILIDKLNDKFLELGNFSLTERNNDIMNQQKKLDEMNEFLEKGKQLNYETNLYLNQKEKILKIVPKLNTLLVSDYIDDIWFTEIQPLNFNSYINEESLFIENTDKYNMCELFSEIREVNNCIVFRDLQENVVQEKANLLQFDKEAFEISKLDFQFYFKNCNNFIIYNTVIEKPYSLLSSLTYLNHSEVLFQNSWFSVIIDPTTNKLYFISNYDSIYIVLEYADIKAFMKDVNDYKTLDLDESLDGTYIVAFNGNLYYNITKSNKICMSSLSSGKKEIEFGLKTPCFRNTASFRWGGLNDIAFLIDTKTLKRYVLYQKTFEDQFTQILEINSCFYFDLHHNIILPLPKKSIGFCFIYDNIIYIGSYHYKAEIHYLFNLKEISKGIQNFNLSFDKAKYITNINVIQDDDGLSLIVSDFYCGLLIYKVNLKHDI